MSTKKPTTQESVTDDGFHVVQSSELKPFVDWNETPAIEGVCGNFRIVKGEFGDQEVCDVGEFSVGMSTTLHNLPKYNGEYLRIRYEGMQESKGGRTFKSFTILARNRPAPE